MFRASFFSIFFLAFCPVVFSQNADPYNLIRDQSSPEFWENVRVLPVQFTEKTTEKTGHIRFSASFASNLVVEPIEFVLLAKQEKEDAFFEQTKEWEQKINRKAFLKKFKKDFWLTTYLKSGSDNIIISAHQFKQWSSLKLSFAGHPERLRRHVDSPEFWHDIRIKIAVFFAINENKAHWLFLEQIKKIEPFSDLDRKLYPLTNGQVTTLRLTGNPLADFRILEQGIFYIQPNTIFHKQEMENTKPRKMLTFTVTNAKLRLRPLSIERGEFIAKLSKSFWICFYDSKFQSLVRVVQALEEQGKPE